jgi:asparagine synthase (glutamine-hydrolysing)
VCGIAGIFFVDDGPLVDRFANGAVEILAHRGPDDSAVRRFPQGVFVHRRLSILDPTPAGNQPFETDDGRILLIHNGEVYNYLELREELAGLGHRFRTDTDTEVIAAAYAEWGDEAIGRFNGIWAFALWDAARNRLLLSRDRLGVKPLYLIRIGGGIAFASEIKALRPVMSSIAPNLSALRDFALHAWQDHSDATFYEGVEPLPPARNLVWDSAGASMRSYWEPPLPGVDSDPGAVRLDEQLVADFGALLKSAVELQLRSDVPLGSCLSGGLDSASIVAMSAKLVAEKLGPHGTAPRIALTASFPGSAQDESALAGEVASRAGVQHRLVGLQPGDLIETLDMVLAEQDEPFQSASILAQRAVMEAARAEGIKVMLDGQGADELLGGYGHYRYAWLLGLMRGHPTAVPPALRSLRRFGIAPAVALRQALLEQSRLGPSGLARFGGDARVPAWVGPKLRQAAPLPLRGEGGGSAAGSPLARQLRRAALATSLPALLRFEDRNSMRFGVEARVPYLDHRLVEASMRLPDRLKIGRDGTSKVALRRSVSGLVQDSVRLDRRKIGFAVPQQKWLTDSASELRAAFERSRAVDEGVLTRAGVDELIARSPAADGGATLWRALSIERWLTAL